MANSKPVRVKVKDGKTIQENGCIYRGGVQLWIPEDRLRQFAGAIEVVKEVAEVKLPETRVEPKPAEKPAEQK